MQMVKEEINDKGKSNYMIMQKIKNMMKKENGEEEDFEKEKDKEIERLKSSIIDLQKQAIDLENTLYKGREKRKKLLEVIQGKNKQQVFNGENIKILFNAIDKQEQDVLLNSNLIKSKEIIIKDYKNKENGKFLVPHYSLPLECRYKSIEKND